MSQQTSNQTASTSGENASASDGNATSPDTPPLRSRHRCRNRSDECHYLGHVESVPIRHGSDLRIVRRACVYREGSTWFVMNYNLHGPDQGICYRLPGPKNCWMARVDSIASLNDLNDLVVSHETKEQRGYDYIYYMTSDDDDVDRSVIVECVKGQLEGRIRRVVTSAKKICALQRKMGFRVLDF